MDKLTTVCKALRRKFWQVVGTLNPCKLNHSDWKRVHLTTTKLFGLVCWVTSKWLGRKIQILMNFFINTVWYPFAILDLQQIFCSYPNIQFKNSMCFFLCSCGCTTLRQGTAKLMHRGMYSSSIHYVLV